MCRWEILLKMFFSCLTSLGRHNPQKSSLNALMATVDHLQGFSLKAGWNNNTFPPCKVVAHCRGWVPVSHMPMWEHFHRHLFLVRPALLAECDDTWTQMTSCCCASHYLCRRSGSGAKRRQCCQQSSPSVGLVWYANHWGKHDSAPALCVVICQDIYGWCMLQSKHIRWILKWRTHGGRRSRLVCPWVAQEAYDWSQAWCIHFLNHIDGKKGQCFFFLYKSSQLIWFHLRIALLCGCYCTQDAWASGAHNAESCSWR